MRVHASITVFVEIHDDLMTPAGPMIPKLKIYSSAERAVEWVAKELEAWLIKYKEYTLTVAPNMQGMYQIMGDPNYDFTLFYLMYRMEYLQAHEHVGPGIKLGLPIVDIKDNLEVEGEEPQTPKVKKNRHDLIELD